MANAGTEYLDKLWIEPRIMSCVRSEHDNCSLRIRIESCNDFLLLPFVGRAIEARWTNRNTSAKDRILEFRWNCLESRTNSQLGRRASKWIAKFLTWYSRKFKRGWSNGRGFERVCEYWSVKITLRIKYRIDLWAPGAISRSGTSDYWEKRRRTSTTFDPTWTESPCSNLVEVVLALAKLPWQ